jgi:hypothetical protein
MTILATITNSLSSEYDNAKTGAEQGQKAIIRADERLNIRRNAADPDELA